MTRYLIFDPSTGVIFGRISAIGPVPDNALVVGDELTEAEWNLSPELWWRVHPMTRQLTDLSDFELRLTQGLNEDTSLPKRPDLTARGR